MKKRMLVSLALGLALSSCAQKNEEQKVKDIDTFLNHYEKLNKFNGAVLVAQRGTIVLAKGYGYRDFDHNVKNDTSSIFQIYSITKTFTSTMIFKLIEQGKLSLRDRLSKFYPSFPNGDNITIEHLLTHTSGINDDAGFDGQETELYRVAKFGENKPHFAPGEDWAYCNGGYQLLGYIIQKITGVSYEMTMRENVFRPLGMTKSGFDFKQCNSLEKTTAYRTFSDEKKEPAVLYDSTGPFAAGAMYSTVGDLYKYYRSVKSHRIISAASQEIAFSPSKKNERYGYGWQISDDVFGPTIISHGGGAAGFRSNFAMIPEDDICIIILNNHENANTEFLTRKIYDLLNNKPLELIEELKLRNTDLEKLVGAFSIKEPMSMMIYTSILDGRLAVQVSGDGKTTVLAKDENTFIQEEAGAILEFQKDNEGVYSQIKIIQGRSTILGHRIKSSWGMIGDATSKGWEDSIPDIKLSEDQSRPGFWYLENIALRKGSLKFRLNNDWNINYGDNKADGILDLFGESMSIAEGVYDITLDLTNESVPRYSISRKNE